ncbi:MAG: AzlD domain-containing protein [Candidatus Adiutrix sp.]|jgi:branched-subunit amino acid transport protein AzlD|nr:AzlD domain-containing protein [Candidatus Adiutrix sp.]
MSDSAYAFLTVLTVAAATFLTRAAPFLLFPPGRPTPKYIIYLGKSLPCAAIGMLIVYCLKTVQPLIWPHGLPEAISVAAVALLQHFGRNILLSIAAGVLMHMALIQIIFA